MKKQKPTTVKAPRMQTVYVAMYVDYSDTCDGKARSLGLFPDEKSAQAEVLADMHDWKKPGPGRYRRDYKKLRIWNVDHTIGCEWSIQQRAFRVDYWGKVHNG